MATVLARDTNLTDAEIGAAQAALNGLDIPELMAAVSAAPHSATELFELAWLDDDPASSLAGRTHLLFDLFGDERGEVLRRQLLGLARIVADASTRPLRDAPEGSQRGYRRAEQALGSR